MKRQFDAMKFTDYDSYIDIIEWMKQENDTFANANEIVWSGKIMTLQTFEGVQVARQGDYIMKKPEGEFFVCAPFYR